MRIIPAIDIIDGKCVRLSKGDYHTKKVYNEDPLEVAKYFEASGMQYLHLVDLDGARSKQVQHLRLLETIATQTHLQIDFGGGISNKKTARQVLNAGACQLTFGSMAVQDPVLFLDCLSSFGADKIMLGADCTDRKIAVNAWSDNTNLDVIEFISNYEEKGLKYVVVTDISKDGMLQGPAADLYADLLTQMNVKLIASGGISSINDVKLLQQIGCEGVIIGKALYESRVSLQELAELC